MEDIDIVKAHKCKRCNKADKCTKEYMDRLKCVLRNSDIKDEYKKFNQKRQKNMVVDTPHKGWGK